MEQIKFNSENTVFPLGERGSSEIFSGEACVCLDEAHRKYAISNSRGEV